MSCDSLFLLFQADFPRLVNTFVATLIINTPAWSIYQICHEDSTVHSGLSITEFGALKVDRGFFFFFFETRKKSLECAVFCGIWLAENSTCVFFEYWANVFVFGNHFFYKRCAVSSKYLRKIYIARKHRLVSSKQTFSSDISPKLSLLPNSSAFFSYPQNRHFFVILVALDSAS